MNMTAFEELARRALPSHHSYSKISIWTLLIRRLLQRQHLGHLYRQLLDMEPLQELFQHLDWDNLQLLQWLQHFVLLTAANSFGFRQSATALSFGAAQQPATTLSFSFGLMATLSASPFPLDVSTAPAPSFGQTSFSFGAPTSTADIAKLALTVDPATTTTPATSTMVVSSASSLVAQPPLLLP
ncbi:Nuclear pore glycoprotein p62, partial [Daphnia magna]